MIDYQEALNNMCASCQCEEAVNCRYNGGEQDYCWDRIRMQKLVDQVTPQKMEPRKTGTVKYHVCPVCHSMVIPKDRYCANCGQRIDTILEDE